MSETETSMRVTHEQAQAFVAALTGYEEVNEVGDEKGRPRSPAALTHLQAALGLFGVAGFYEVRQSALKDAWDDPTYHPRVRALADYLRAVADALVPPTKSTEPPTKVEPPDRLADFLAKVDALCLDNYHSIGVDITCHAGGRIEEKWNAYDSRVSFSNAASAYEVLDSLAAKLANLNRKADGKVVDADVLPPNPVPAGDGSGEPPGGVQPPEPWPEPGASNAAQAAAEPTERSAVQVPDTKSDDETPF